MTISEKRKKLKVACLVRVSTEEQAKYGFSVEAQKDALDRWAHQNGVSVAGWYIDEGVSARKKVKNRPALQRLLADIQSGGEIDLIIFTKLDRYFRSVSEYHETQKILELHGVHWKAIEEDYDTTTTDGRFKINIMLSIAEQEADRTGDRIRFINAHKIKKRQAITGKIAHGYTIAEDENGIKRVVIDDTKADYVREIFDYFLQYNSISKTTKYINTEKGLTLHYNTVKRILKNPFYTGVYYGVEDYCPAYISKDTHAHILEILKTRHVKHRRTNRVYLFSGILRCPNCGLKMSGMIGKKLKKTGEETIFYRCPNYQKNKSCDFNRSINERLLEAWLKEKITPELERFVAEIDLDQPAAVPVELRLEISAEMERLNYMFEKNRIDISDYDKKYTELEKRLEALDAAPAPVDLSRVRDFLNSDILDIYSTLSRDDKRAAWRQIIETLIVSNNGDHAVHFFKS
ncbi:MAG: recombinase family protein [Prevotella sp.]|nr:recombinase family protein [Prevotella sp.]